MDPLTSILIAAAVVSFATSAGSIISSFSLIYERAGKAHQKLGTMSTELRTLSEVMREVEEVLAAGKDGWGLGSGSQPLLMALEATCFQFKEKFYFVADTFERFLREKTERRSKLSSLRLAFLFINRGDDLMAAYQSLRDSASLARDLASDLKVEILLARVDAHFSQRLIDFDYRVNHQLSELTGSVATLLLDEEEDNGAQPIAGNLGDTNAPRGGGSRGGFRKMARIGRKMVELSETGFTQSITLILDTQPMEDPNAKTTISRQKEVMVIGKLDTASDANLVSYDILIDAGLQEELLIPIPVDKMVELHGLEGAKCTPEWEVTLQWYRPRDMRRRKEKFYVIKNALFEVLFSSDSSFKQMSDRSVHISLERFKPKKEALAEIQAEEENRKKALERVEREYREAEAMNRVPVRRDTGFGSPRSAGV